MSDLLTAAAMGVVEGLTEFIPVSSTGHLILAGTRLGVPADVQRSFDIFIQAGAILAVVFAYPARWAALFRSGEAGGFRGLRGLTLLALTTAPAAAVGLLCHGYIERRLFTPVSVAIGLAAGALWMLAAERFNVSRRRDGGMDGIGWRDALAIGLFQCLALWPGVSRSASTILGGMAIGLERRTATEYSFFAAVPLLGLASIYALFKAVDGLTVQWIPFFATGFATSFAFGWLSIRLLVRFLGRHTLDGFAWYRLALAAVILFAARN